MRFLFPLLLALFLLPLGTQAQGVRSLSGTDLGSSRLVDFQPTEEVRLSDEQMALVQKDRDYAALLQASNGNTVTAARGHTLYTSTDSDGGCDREAPCIILIGEGRLYVPFSSDGGLGGTRVTSLIVYDDLTKLTVNADQREAIAEGPLAVHLRVDDGTVTGGRGVALYATDRSGDCSSSNTACLIGLEQDGFLSVWGVP